MSEVISILCLILVASTLVIVPLLVLRAEWLPRCPVCRSRGYRHVCNIGDDDPGAEVRRCRTCHVYRIKLGSGWRDLSWDHWQKEASAAVTNAG